MKAECDQCQVELVDGMCRLCRRIYRDALGRVVPERKAVGVRIDGDDDGMIRLDPLLTETYRCAGCLKPFDIRKGASVAGLSCMACMGAGLNHHLVRQVEGSPTERAQRSREMGRESPAATQICDCWACRGEKAAPPEPRVPVPPPSRSALEAAFDDLKRDGRFAVLPTNDLWTALRGLLPPQVNAGDWVQELADKAWRIAFPEGPAPVLDVEWAAGATVTKPTAPEPPAVQILCDLAANSTDERVRLDAALALLANGWGKARP